MSVTIELNAKYEAKKAGALIRTLAEGDTKGVTEIILDIRKMTFYEPLALCIILATVPDQVDRGRELSVLEL